MCTVPSHSIAIYSLPYCGWFFIVKVYFGTLYHTSGAIQQQQMVSRLVFTAKNLATQLQNDGAAKTFVRVLKHHGQIKSGTLVGVDKFGNKYFEDDNPDPNVDTSGLTGRNRWVEYPRIWNYDASQIPPEWHSWLHFTSDAPDPVLSEKFSSGLYKLEHSANRTGTDKAYTPNNYLTNPNYDWHQATNTPKHEVESVHIKRADVLGIKVEDL
eukprot:TRINITY_DN2421_c0_g1_i1.p1 TRINITY_DN2421_c0_g1~~TRINITY_DN2421_c0_g1_i1.p1  ORF type:complete len:212 (-),score=48.69 TRINITY_DN2421_c0_g1_i1:91-726(-)